MRTKQAVIVIIAVLAWVVVCAQAGNAVPSEESRGQCQTQDREEKFSKMGEELGLTAEQAEQLKAQKESSAEKRGQIKEQLRSKREQLEAELEKPTVDQAAVDALIGDITGLVGGQLRNRVESVLATKSVLTPEQYQKLQEKIKEKKHDRMAGRGKKSFKKHGFGKQCDMPPQEGGPNEVEQQEQ